MEQYGAGVGDDFDAKITYEMVIINCWYSKHYGARVGDDFDAKRNYF